ncbi:Cullin repeat-like-containing domain,Conserved oligomeric Golgi complex subunit 8 [Cinara cedri]|uniref:Conserved oligomeric Golgi complex subunit 8 n=1 Tax=Cinara cedri TaxID=506608 RepID=A0A5E4NB41_9HEMI|nr:Cullin repeat-like-containing domain,Conserved oligomeric Golgi complex subunit 8 [Cinara cedri]
MNGQLADLLFPDGMPDDLKTDPNIKTYLDHLGMCTAEELSKEHKTLEDKNGVIVNMIKDLALSNYKTFVKTSQCYESVYTKFDETQHKTVILDNYLLKLKTECQEMLQQWADVKEKRHRNTLAMIWNSRIMHHALELPQLMLSCIQNKLYEEALKLADHSRHLPNNIPAVKLLHTEVEKYRLTLMSALCQELRTELELPQCMRIVRLLRSLNRLSEEQLAVKFLQTRNTWFNSKLENIPVESNSQHLLKTIEVLRSCLSSIATQYNLIFCSEDNSSEVGSSKQQYYYSWANQKVCQFLNILKKDLPHCQPSSLETIFTQCMYFGQSLGHIGADFRGLIAPVFINVTVKRFSDLLKITEKTWLIDLQTFLKTNIKNVRMNQTHDEVDDIPSPVFEYYPLAKFCNGVMSALNDLGEYAPYAAADEITKCLHTTLHNASCSLFSMYYQEDFKNYEENDKKIFGQLCICFSTDVVPYVQKCLHKVYEPASIAAFIGVTTTSLQKENLTFIDSEIINEPIKELLDEFEKNILIDDVSTN